MLGSFSAFWVETLCRPEALENETGGLQRSLSRSPRCDVVTFGDFQ